MRLLFSRVRCCAQRPHGRSALALLTLLVLAALPGRLLAQGVVTFGGLDIEEGRSVAVDASGNAVVTGSFQGTVDFDPGAGMQSRTSAGVTDVFVARYAPNGTFVSVITFGGASNDVGYSVAVDASGNAVVTGYFQGTADFDPGAGVQNRSSAGDLDVFVARYTPNGTFVSVATFGSKGTDLVQGVAVDASGKAVVIGSFEGTADFDPGAGVQNRTSAGVADLFVVRYAADGTFVSVATFGSASDDRGNGVAVDASGNAVVVGTFSGTADFDPGVGVVSRTSAGGRDVFVARYAPTGILVSTATGDERPLARTSRIVLLGTRAVRVELAEAEPSLRLTLYDVLGRAIARLHDGPADAGSIDARIPRGLPAGAYLVRAQGVRFTDATTLVLR